MVLIVNDQSVVIAKTISEATTFVLSCLTPVYCSAYIVIDSAFFLGTTTEKFDLV